MYPQVSRATLAAHAKQVEAIAWSLARSLPPGVDREDLTQAGYIGLLEAIGSFEPARGLQISTHAQRRIRGAMLDMMRGTDPLYRSDRQALRALHAFEARHFAQHGCAPAASERAAAIGLTLKEFRRFEADVCASPEALHAQDQADIYQYAPDSLAMEREKWREFAAGAATLDPRSQFVFDAVVFGGMRALDVAAQIGVSPSRVAQIVKAAAAKIRDHITKDGTND